MTHAIAIAVAAGFGLGAVAVLALGAFAQWLRRERRKIEARRESLRKLRRSC